ncbi:hypothetical protein EDD16DRAFT_1627948 [Pisolithus croceorrhizus]|nr:hypothetical protein EDD16DRAFT_1627948 [Pisolithus croceorrhizus]
MLSQLPLKHISNLHKSSSLTVRSVLALIRLRMAENTSSPLAVVLLQNISKTCRSSEPRHTGTMTLVMCLTLMMGCWNITAAQPGTVQETLPPSSRVNKYDCCSSIPCLCMGPGGGECSQLINCGGVPDHLRDVHGIINLARGHPLDCTWRDCGCRVTRHNYVRHVRECHLQHNRNATHKNSVRYTHREGEPGRYMGAT